MKKIYVPPMPSCVYAMAFGGTIVLKMGAWHGVLGVLILNPTSSLLSTWNLRNTGCWRYGWLPSPRTACTSWWSMWTGVTSCTTSSKLAGLRSLMLCKYKLFPWDTWVGYELPRVFSCIGFLHILGCFFRRSLWPGKKVFCSTGILLSFLDTS